MAAEIDDGLKWLMQWQNAAVDLARVHDEELRTLSEEQALRASEAVLSMMDGSKVPEWRNSSSGLVEQQRVLHAQRHK